VLGGLPDQSKELLDVLEAAAAFENEGRMSMNPFSRDSRSTKQLNADSWQMPFGSHCFFGFVFLYRGL